MTGGPPKENEVRRLLSKAWSRRRRRADFFNLQNALHLDLNREFEERRSDGSKYFFFVLLVFALLIYALTRRSAWSRRSLRRHLERPTPSLDNLGSAVSQSA